MEKVYLLTYGDGSDGDAWGVVSIHNERKSAEEERERDGWGTNIHGKRYSKDWEILEWDVR